MATLTIRDIILLQQADLEKAIDGPCIWREVTMPDTGIMVTAIAGPRRSGKSWLAIRHLSGTGSGTFGYIDLGDERLGSLSDPGTILAAIDSVYGKETSLLLDGITSLMAWEEFVERLVREGCRVVIADSSKSLHGPDAAARFFGRCVRILVLPLSFGEYLALKRHGPAAQERIAALQTYVETGGFPEPLTRTISGRDYLRAHFDAIMFRDVIRHHNIRSVQGIGALARCLLAAVGTEYSYGSLARAMRGMSAMTIRSHLGYLEDAFLFFSLPRFSPEKRERAPANKKIYCIDTGLVAARGLLTPENRGRLYENLVAIELWKREQQEGFRVSYWKNVQADEVDFVVQQEGRIAALIQVCADKGGGNARKRKIRALLKASRAFQCYNLLLLSEEDENTEVAAWFGMTGTIRSVPVWKWLEHPQTGTGRDASAGPVPG